MHTIEPLEQRRLFSGDPIFELTSKGTLIVHGTAGNDSIVGRLLDGKSNPVQVILKPVDPPAGSPVVTHEFRGRLSAVKRLRFEGGDGDDQLLVYGFSGLVRPATLLGGAGNDSLSGGYGPGLVDGGDGDDAVGDVPAAFIRSSKNRDVLNAAFADDGHGVLTLLGGNGNDTLGGDINDVVDGGAGNDQARLVVILDGQPKVSGRGDAIAFDYYQRIGASSIEAFWSAGLDSDHSGT